MLATVCRIGCVIVLVGASGCAMCSSCDDYSYAGSGGRWERLDPTFGRVGSAFTPEVGALTEGYEGDYEDAPELLSPGEPTPADEPAPADDAAPADEPAPADDAAPKLPAEDSLFPEASVLRPRGKFSR